MRSPINTVAVVDFRRTGMVLNWHTLGGTRTACDVRRSLVHGIALIRPDQPNMCLYAQGGQLTLQIGPNAFAVDPDAPRISCTLDLLSLGFKRRFRLERDRATLYSYAYWQAQGADFFVWLAESSKDPGCRRECARQWSQGVPPAQLCKP